VAVVGVVPKTNEGTGYPSATKVHKTLLRLMKLLPK